MPTISDRTEDRSDTDDREKRKEDHEDHQPEGFVQIFRRWPKASLFIIGNEFCERFSYYGMRSVLTLYFINILQMENANAKFFFHAFTVLAYFTPLFGSMLADGYIGKFWTILILSIVYAIGQLILAASSYIDFIHPWLDALGLLIIAIGTGGIKPCVSSFGGDQFNPAHTRMISIFFSLFYFSINAGSTVSMFLTPLFRSISCLGKDSCYPLAFGVPAILMLVATGLFIFGSAWYKKHPPKENVIGRVITTINRAIMNKRRSSEKKPHWLDHALDDHDCVNDIKCLEHDSICAQESFVKDVKSLVRVVVMMTPFPMFWALYDQQGSTWTMQAMNMDSRIVGDVYLLPDQMQVLNAILILVFIPFFQAVVYPLVEKMGIEVTMLRKIAAGGILAAISFILCAVVQGSIQGTLVPPLEPNSAHLTLVNTYPSVDGCSFKPVYEGWSETPIAPKMVFDSTTDLHVVSALSKPFIPIHGEGQNCPVNVPMNVKIEKGESYAVFITPSGYSTLTAPMNKPQKGGGEYGLSIVLDFTCDYLREETKWIDCQRFYNGTMAICEGEECNWNDKESFYIWDLSKKNDEDKAKFLSNSSVKTYDASVSTRSIVRYPKIDIKPKKYSFHILNKNENGELLNDWKIPNVTIDFDEMGSVYTIVISERGISSIHRSVPPNTISILWQIPQYIVLTAAEVLFSVTGLEFAYQEAAPTLKSVVTALYLMSVAFGDFIIIAFTQINPFKNQVFEMLAFSVAMFIFTGIFVLLSIYYYTYAHYDKDEEEDEEKKE